jgi:lipoprotein-anchoring transpeptidase ErfK/SrfK
VRALLRLGVLAGCTGQRAEAQRYFRAALQADPDSLVALLWLAWLAPSQPESLTLFGRALELDPGNPRARAGLRWARGHAFAGQAAAGAPGGGDALAAIGPSAAGAALPTLEPAEGSDLPHHAAPVRRLAGPLIVLLALAACLFMVGVALIARYSPTAVLAWVLPTATPTATPVPTPTPTATASPTTMPTATPSPTATFTPTAAPPTPTLALPANGDAPVLPPLSSTLAEGEKWIEVDLTNQRLTAYEGDTPVLQTLVSTGLANTPTVVGEFRIYSKLAAVDMAGPGYYLPAVPYTMYFYRGYALHGTYWHDNFGHPMSHGCVNLRTEDAQWLYDWADPPMAEGAKNARATDASPGTRVVVHY